MILKTQSQRNKSQTLSRPLIYQAVKKVKKPQMRWPRKAWDNFLSVKALLLKSVINRMTHNPLSLSSPNLQSRQWKNQNPNRRLSSSSLSVITSIRSAWTSRSQTVWRSSTKLGSISWSSQRRENLSIRGLAMKCVWLPFSQPCQL